MARLKRSKEPKPPKGTRPGHYPPPSRTPGEVEHAILDLELLEADFKAPDHEASRPGKYPPPPFRG